MNKLQERKQNDKGFSLVELIIVIAIMAVLVAILAPAFMRYVEESRQKADITAVDEIIQSAKAAYTNEEFSISGGSVKLVVSKTKKVGDSASGDLKTALDNSDVSDATLKSSKWGDVEITLTEATSGALKATVKSVNDKGVKIEDKYNKK